MVFSSDSRAFPKYVLSDAHCMQKSILFLAGKSCIIRSIADFKEADKEIVHGEN